LQRDGVDTGRVDHGAGPPEEIDDPVDALCGRVTGAHRGLFGPVEGDELFGGVGGYHHRPPFVRVRGPIFAPRVGSAGEQRKPFPGAGVAVDDFGERLDGGAGHEPRMAAIGVRRVGVERIIFLVGVDELDGEGGGVGVRKDPLRSFGATFDLDLERVAGEIDPQMRRRAGPPDHAPGQHVAGVEPAEIVGAHMERVAGGETGLDPEPYVAAPRVGGGSSGCR
jgi:hypothetical protein